MISVQVYSVDKDQGVSPLLHTEMDEVPFPGDELMCRLGSLRVVRRTYLLQEDDVMVGAILWVRVERVMEP